MSLRLINIGFIGLICCAAYGQDKQWCQGNASDDKFGKVTIGKPKVWRFDRIFSTLDGLLRDVDAVQVHPLTSLDSNSIQQAVADYLSTSFDVKAKFSEADVASNMLAKQSVASQQIQNGSALEQQRQLVSLNSELMKTITHQATLNATDPAYQTDQTKITNVTAAITALKGVGLTAVPSATPKDTSSDAAAAAATPMVKADDLKALLGDSKGSVPPTRQLDRFITLLHERLSRELSTVFDDSRQNSDIYLLQFDVGAFPTKKATGRVLGVDFDIAGEWLAYDLYPAASAYNVAQYSGVTKSIGVSGAFGTLIGLGASADYKREHDRISESVLESIYLSGFGSGQGSFGWVLGSSPSENVISPGIHTMYALIQGPHTDGSASVSIQVTPRFGWFPHNGLSPTGQPQGCRATGGAFNIALPVADDIAVTKVAYKTRYIPVATLQGGAAEDATKDFAYIELSIANVIDPNMVITVNGQVLKRVRDFRGRATNITAVGKSQFGLLETDSDDDNSWFATGSKNITLKVSRALATTTTFPTIRLLGSGVSPEGLRVGNDLLGLIRKSCSNNARAASLWINDVEINPCVQGMAAIAEQTSKDEARIVSVAFSPVHRVTASDKGAATKERRQLNSDLAATTLTPLFTSELSPGPTVLADTGKLTEKAKFLRIQLDTARFDTSSVAHLDENTQVLIRTHAETEAAWDSLECRPSQSGLDLQILICQLPIQYQVKVMEHRDVEVSVERPSQGTTPGFQARTHLADKPVIFPHTISPVVDDKGEVTEWNVDVVLWMTDVSSSLPMGFPAGSRGPLECTTIRLMDTLSSEPDFQHETLTIPRTCLGFIRKTPFFVGPIKDAIEIKDLFSWFMPYDMSVDAEPDINTIILKGKNIQTVDAVVLRGYERPHCKSECDEVPVAKGSRILSFQVPLDLKPGYYPVLFKVGGAGDRREIYEPYLANGDGIGLQFNGTPQAEAAARTLITATVTPPPAKRNPTQAQPAVQASPEPPAAAAPTPKPVVTPKPRFELKSYAVQLKLDQKQTKLQ